MVGDKNIRRAETALHFSGESRWFHRLGRQQPRPFRRESSPGAMIGKAPILTQDLKATGHQPFRTSRPDEVSNHGNQGCWALCRHEIRSPVRQEQLGYIPATVRLSTRSVGASMP